MRRCHLCTRTIRTQSDHDHHMENVHQIHAMSVKQTPQDALLVAAERIVTQLDRSASARFMNLDLDELRQAIIQVKAQS